MLKHLLGNKVGMTQIFNQDQRVVPVTVVNYSNWYVTQVKSQATDGYRALQIGSLKKKYQGQKLAIGEMLKNKATYFSHLREIEIAQDAVLGQEIKPGYVISADAFGIAEGDVVSVAGLSTGKGFQGVVKRWGFVGGPRSHGSMFGRAPGAIGHMRTQGKVIKGKKLPGQCGHKQITVKGLKVVKIDKDNECIFIKGAIPGKANTLVSVKKQG
jgi:large subunit ribosomal protein L3